MAEYTRNGNGTNELTSVAQRPAPGYMPLRQVMDRLVQDSFLPSSLFNEAWSDWPSLWTDGANARVSLAGTNLWETKDGYVLQIAMPGMNPESIDCTVEQNILTCRAQPSIPTPENATPVWQGFGGQAAYRVQLPDEVEAGQALASYENGVLTIALPKAVHARPHSIKVTAK